MPGICADFAIGRELQFVPHWILPAAFVLKYVAEFGKLPHTISISHFIGLENFSLNIFEPSRER